jgi:glycosyltransferase involved in cell wall biosynthesis
LVGKRNKYEEVIKKECGEFVKIVGEIPYTEMHKFYKAADILMHLSLTEGSVSGTTIEAIACGLPIVSTPAGEAQNLLPNVFESPAEFANFLLCGNWKKTKLPPEFKNETIRTKYIKVFRRLGR